MKILIFLIFISFYIVFVQPVSAHVLKTDGSIGAVIHIDPEDDPIAGSPAHFYFEFKDRENKFNPDNCVCTFSVNADDKELFSYPLFENKNNQDLNSDIVSYTFPERNIYQVRVSGTPKTEGQFKPFNLTYDIRVERGQSVDTVENSSENNGDNSINSYWWYWLFGGILVGGLFLVFLKSKKKHA